MADAVDKLNSGRDMGEWDRENEPWGGQESENFPSPYPVPAQPEQDPFRVIPAPPHMSNELWQTSYYDATSYGPVSSYTQRPAGPCSLETGRLIDGDWPQSRIWKQV
jgi:hypothetical protein